MQHVVTVGNFRLRLTPARIEQRVLGRCSLARPNTAAAIVYVAEAISVAITCIGQAYRTATFKANCSHRNRRWCCYKTVAVCVWLHASPDAGCTVLKTKTVTVIQSVGRALRETACARTSDRLTQRRNVATKLAAGVVFPAPSIAVVKCCAGAGRSCGTGRSAATCCSARAPILKTPTITDGD